VAALNVMLDGFAVSVLLVVAVFIFIFYKSLSPGVPSSFHSVVLKAGNTSEAKCSSRQALIHQLFSMLDVNKDGKIEQKEMEIEIPNAGEFFAVIDTDCNHFITEAEFKAFLDDHVVSDMDDADVDRLNKLCKLAWMHKSKTKALGANELFDSLDINNDGQLSLRELELVVGDDAEHFLRALDAVHK
jgi:Ca2+-binding EF-hand superfamily protein